MVREFVVGGALLAALSLLPPVAAYATHDSDLTDPEVGCQIGTSRSIGKLVSKQILCVDTCYALAFSGQTAFANCVAPFGGVTAGCVQTAADKYEGRIRGGCSKDCPECYSGGDCPTEAGAKVDDAAAHVVSLVGDIFCDDSSSADGLTFVEFRCQRYAARALAKFEAAKRKCLDRCHRGEHRAKVALGSCVPSAVSDPETVECIAREEQKAIVHIDPFCEPTGSPSSGKPECGPYASLDGAGWVAAVEAAIDARDATLYCGE
jgi:hypothetical protein